MIKTKSQKVLGANSYVCRSYRGKTSMGGLFAPPPILNRVKHQSHKMVKHTQTIRRLLPPETLLYLNNHYATNVEEQL